VVFVLCAFYTFNRRMLESDPVVAKALSSAPTEAKSLLDALDAYHLAHGVYPRSVKDLPRDPLWENISTRSIRFFAVYKSLDCQRRMHDLMGIQTPEKIRLGKETQAECLLGIRSSSSRPMCRQSTGSVCVVVFDSANPKWPSIGARQTTRRELLLRGPVEVAGREQAVELLDRAAWDAAALTRQEPMCRWLGTDDECVRPYANFYALTTLPLRRQDVHTRMCLVVRRPLREPAQIDVPAPFGYVVRVADGCRLRPLAANITNSCHD